MRSARVNADLVAAEGPNVRMSDVAERAEVSLATAYRHFSSVDEALVQYRMDAGLKLYAHSVSSEARGLELLKDVSDYWITLVLCHGRVMVTTRSREGFLKRLRSGARYLTVAADALDEPIRQAAAELGLPRAIEGLRQAQSTDCSSIGVSRYRARPCPHHGWLPGLCRPGV